MTARRTNNSLAAHLDGGELVIGYPFAGRVIWSFTARFCGKHGATTSSTASAPVVAAGVQNPALIAAIVDAVKASFASEKGPGSSASNLHGNFDSVEPQGVLGGVPAQSPSLRSKWRPF